MGPTARPGDDPWSDQTKEDAWPDHRPHKSSMSHSAAANALLPASFSGCSWTSSTWPLIGKQAH
jgi:hypothetical protein